MSARKRIVAAVFPPLPDASNPTPAATPVLGSNDPAGEAWTFPIEPEPENLATQQIRWDRAWHTATTFLSLPAEPLTAAHANLNEEALRGRWIKPYTPEISNDVRYVIAPQSRRRQLRAISPDDDLLEWYLDQVQRHYLGFVRPGVLKALKTRSDSDALLEALRLLQVAQAIYLHPLRNHLLLLLQGRGKYELARFWTRLHGLVANSLDSTLLAEHLGGFLKTEGSIVLGLQDDNAEGDGDRMMEGAQDSDLLIEEARQKALTVMRSLHDVGLGGGRAQRIFAEVMNDMLNAHVKSAYAGQWASPSTVIERLRDWVENQFARFTVEILACLKEENDFRGRQTTDVSLADVERWQEMGINRLGALRTNELFNVIVDWEEGSKGAIEDLKHYVTTTAARTHLTTSFSNVVSHRLLQPGAATIEILQVYISIIRAFAVLDPKGVLLDRIARPIRRYLRERDDTVKIIVGGLLADADVDEGGATDVLVELATELNKITEIQGENDDEELDWDDMSWVPDPIDAGPEYRKSKTSDVIGTLISLFDTKDVFVKEFQNLMGERLLKKEFEFEKEIRVLELLKLRFGEGALQACEVMLRDVLDSRRVDTSIRNDQKLHQDSQSNPTPDFHTKILSRLFWPALHAETFSLPPAITALQSRYSSGFETLKQTRKLTWLPALGQVTVKLDLEDREVVEEVQTWQACVIYAFQDSDNKNNNTGVSSASPATRTVQQLVDDLSMPAPLVLNALTFWVGKLVLAQSSPSTYTVLEALSTSTLNPSSHTAIAAVAASAAASSSSAPSAAVRTEEDVAMEKMGVFWQFIVGMLTNQGPMTLQRIVVMLKFAVPGGFPYGNEELKEFLGGMVREGKVEVGVGGNYRVVHGGGG